MGGGHNNEDKVVAVIIRKTKWVLVRLLYATLIITSRSWKGIRMPPDIWFEIEILRREAFGEPSQMIEKELVAA